MRHQMRHQENRYDSMDRLRSAARVAKLSLLDRHEKAANCTTREEEEAVTRICRVFTTCVISTTTSCTLLVIILCYKLVNHPKLYTFSRKGQEIEDLLTLDATNIF